MKTLQHANKQQTAYRACRRALNNLGKSKDRTAAHKRPDRKRK